MQLLRHQLDQSARLLLIAVPPILLATLWLAFARIHHGRRASRAIAHSVLDGLFLLSIAVVLAATMLPLRGPHATYLMPFRNTREALDTQFRSTVVTIVGNVLLFVPFGFMYAARARGRLLVWRALLYSLLFSVAVETVQLIVPGRTTSIDDVILNAFGGFAGALFYVMFAAPAPRSRGASASP